MEPDYFQLILQIMFARITLAIFTRAPLLCKRLEMEQKMIENVFVFIRIWLRPNISIYYHARQAIIMLETYPIYVLEVNFCSDTTAVSHLKCSLLTKYGNWLGSVLPFTYIFHQEGRKYHVLVTNIKLR